MLVLLRARCAQACACVRVHVRACAGPAPVEFGATTHTRIHTFTHTTHAIARNRTHNRTQARAMSLSHSSRAYTRRTRARIQARTCAPHDYFRCARPRLNPFGSKPEPACDDDEELNRSASPLLPVTTHYPHAYRALYHFSKNNATGNCFLVSSPIYIPFS